MRSLIEKATIVAASAHKEQVRKTDGSSYVAHPIEVGRILTEAGFDEAVVAAGLVHDVLEDTEVTEEELRQQLGDVVTDIVLGVTEDKNLPWEERKEQYVEQVVSSNEAVKAVCIADKIHNAQSLIFHHGTMGAGAWAVFSKGKDKKIAFEELVYEKVAATWQHPLLKRYKDLIEQLKQLED